MTKVILISQMPLPYHKIGSWTTLYKNYLESDSHQIDFIICQEPLDKIKGINYSYVKTTLIDKLLRKINYDNRFISYFRALKKITKNDEKYIIQIVDNLGLAIHLNKFLLKNGLRNNCYVQYFYHGFPPPVDKGRSDVFFESIDELILLTKDCYQNIKHYYSALPVKISILYNGIDNNKFFKLDSDRKAQIKKEKNVDDKTVFLWCSQNRPKKGLFIILEAWKKIHQKEKNIELWVVGTEKKETASEQGIKYFGKIPNDELPKYFQMADVYLFPTLFQEGFPISLTEALHCGCYCIASNYGGVAEVLNYGQFGKLIDQPHFINHWIDAIEVYLNDNNKDSLFNPDLYTITNWNDDYNTLINEVKRNF